MNEQVVLVFAPNRWHFDHVTRNHLHHHYRYVYIKNIDTVVGRLRNNAILLEGYEQNPAYTLWLMHYASTRLNMHFISEGEIHNEPYQN